MIAEEFDSHSVSYEKLALHVDSSWYRWRQKMFQSMISIAPKIYVERLLVTKIFYDLLHLKIPSRERGRETLENNIFVHVHKSEIITSTSPVIDSIKSASFKNP